MIDASYPALREERARVTRDALRKLFADQEFDVLIARRLLGPGWDRRLAEVAFDLNLTTATRVGDLVAADLPGEFTPAFMHNWLRRNAEIGSVAINDATRASLAAAEDDDAKASVFEVLLDVKAAQYAASMVTTAANFGAHDAASAAGGRSKTWGWSGLGPRHSDLSGQTVPMSSAFSNGLAWPGDPAGSADEVAGCQCSVSFD